MTFQTIVAKQVEFKHVFQNCSVSIEECIRDAESFTFIIFS